MPSSPREVKSTVFKPWPWDHLRAIRESHKISTEMAWLQEMMPCWRLLRRISWRFWKVIIRELERKKGRSKILRLRWIISVTVCMLFCYYVFAIVRLTSPWGDGGQHSCNFVQMSWTCDYDKPDIWKNTVTTLAKSEEALQKPDSKHQSKTNPSSNIQWLQYVFVQSNTQQTNLAVHFFFGALPSLKLTYPLKMTGFSSKILDPCWGPGLIELQRFCSLTMWTLVPSNRLFQSPTTRTEME